MVGSRQFSAGAMSHALSSGYGTGELKRRGDIPDGQDQKRFKQVQFLLSLVASRSSKFNVRRGVVVCPDTTSRRTGCRCRKEQDHSPGGESARLACLVQVHFFVKSDWPPFYLRRVSNERPALCHPSCS